MTVVEGPQLAELVVRARRLASGRQRALIGIAGPPGSGKSTVAEALAAALGTDAALVPMDDFHLAQSELERLGRSGHKGAPDTFDAEGYLVLLRRLREVGPEVVYAPLFRRDLEEPIAGAIPVGPEQRIVLTEGNYLLLATVPPWDRVRALLDEIWYVELEDETRVERLVARHVAFGRSPEAARRWVLESDEKNAALIAANRAGADLVLHADAAVLRPG